MTIPRVFARSIRWRLLAWLGFLLGLVLSGFAFTVYQLKRIEILDTIDESLERRAAAIAGDVRGPEPPDGPGGPMRPDGFGPPPGPPPMRRRDEFDGRRPGPRDRDGLTTEVRLSDRTLNLFGPDERYEFYYAVWSSIGTQLLKADSAPEDLPYPARPFRDTRTYVRTREELREAFHFTERGDCVLVGRSIKTDLADLHRSAWYLASAAFAVLGMGLGGAWVIASRAIRPVDDISAAALRISTGHLSERINVDETDSELGRLAGVLNATFSRLESSFAEMKQFTADAAHELRTPLAVIISEAQTALSRERTNADYREALEGCLETAQQMRKLTESLLQLARFDAGEAAMEFEPVDLAGIAETCAELIQPLARSRNVTIETECVSAPVTGDSDRLSRVVLNLLTNAITYNRDGGRIRISTRTDGQASILAVADTGPGIAPEQLHHLFKRFYRADKARSRAEGNTGLGLAICKAIVEMHSGSIGVESKEGIGTTFTMRLPCA